MHVHMYVYIYVCKAGTSWSAKNSDFDQRLIIDLGYVRNVTHIALQGRPHSDEYVTEYSISYGISDLEFADYKEPGGNVKVSPRLTVNNTPTFVHILKMVYEKGKWLQKNSIKVIKDNRSE